MVEHFSPERPPGRRTPAHGVKISMAGPNFVLLTVNTKDRVPWLTQPAVHASLREVWQDADAWLVGDYVLMPDHLHLFCAPCDLKFTIERWMGFWKDRLAKSLPDAGKFQAGGFHHRLRDGVSYAQKWQYVRQNPVRAGLVTYPDDWPHFGRVHEINFSGD